MSTQNEYISKQALLQAINKEPHSNASQRAAQILTCILQAPAVDVVPLIRCKDCRWWKAVPDENHGYCGLYVTTRAIGMYPTDFCSCAERKSNLYQKEQGAKYVNNNVLENLLRAIPQR